MRIQDIAKLSTRMFKTNPARTWLTILGMGVGTGAVVMLVGLGFGLQGIILEKIVFGETLLSLNVSNPSSKTVVLSQSVIDDFLKIEHVKDVSPMASFPALITFEGLTGSIFLQGVNPSYFRYAGIGVLEGNLFDEKDKGADKDSVIISQAVLKLFEVQDPKQIIGKTVRFRVFVSKEDGMEAQEVVIDKEYRIKGITNDNFSVAAIMALPEFSSRFAINHFEKAQVRVDSSDFLNLVQDTVVEKGFLVTALSKTVEQANKIFQGIQAVLAVFGGIALIVSSIGMFNTMTVTLLERTNEIGIMRTIGASPKHIKILFVSEAVIVGFLGGIIGIGLGVGIGLILNLLINSIAGHFGGVAVSLFKFPLLFLVFIAFFSGIVGFITGIFPARRAAALNPLEAIRYK